MKKAEGKPEKGESAEYEAKSHSKGFLKKVLAKKMGKKSSK